MKQSYKLILLSLVVLILTILVVKQSVSFYMGMKGLPFPSPQSRLDNAITVHRWMTVSEVAQKYGFTKKEIFDYLKITPQPGDENLTLRELKFKYQMTSEEMQKNLQLIIDNARNSGQSP